MKEEDTSPSYIAGILQSFYQDVCDNGAFNKDNSIKIIKGDVTQWPSKTQRKVTVDMVRADIRNISNQQKLLALQKQAGDNPVTIKTFRKWLKD